MDRLKKILRLFGLVVMIILASSGLGISGVIFPNHKDKQLLPEIKIELVEEKEEEDEGEMKDVKA